MTHMRTGLHLMLGAMALGLAAGLVGSQADAIGGTDLSTLSRETHFHGIAVDAGDPSRIYLATHNGLFVVDESGNASALSVSRDDFMGFTPHPTDPQVLYASGHPAGGGNLGFIASMDGGRTWHKLADGVGGPVDFHQMDVSKADPKVIYGVHGGIQRSGDGGQTWTSIGPAPEGMIDLAAGRLPDTLYAATQKGLLRSTDAGRNWVPDYPVRQPVTMVHVTGAGEVYAYVVGTGLIRRDEQRRSWKVVGGGLGGQYVLHLAVAAADGQRLYAVTVDPTNRSNSLLTSADAGNSWAALAAE